MGCTLRSSGQGGAAIGHDEARFPGVANVVVLGRADFKPRDLRSDRGYRWRLGVWRLAAFGMAWIENRKEWTSTTFLILRTWGAAVLRPYTSMPRLSDRDYLGETSTEALVFSQDMLRVQPEAAWSKAMVKFSIGEESLETFMSMRARSLLGPG
jgi:hypothetical protein